MKSMFGPRPPAAGRASPGPSERLPGLASAPSQSTRETVRLRSEVADPTGRTSSAVRARGEDAQPTAHVASGKFRLCETPQVEWSFKGKPRRKERHGRKPYILKTLNGLAQKRKRKRLLLATTPQEWRQASCPPTESGEQTGRRACDGCFLTLDRGRHGAATPRGANGRGDPREPRACCLEALRTLRPERREARVSGAAEENTALRDSGAGCCGGRCREHAPDACEGMFSEFSAVRTRARGPGSCELHDPQSAQLTEWRGLISLQGHAKERSEGSHRADPRAHDA